MTNLVTKIYHNKIISYFFHTSVYCLKKELKNCKTVLDLGCGPNSPIRYCRVSYSVGVDAFDPYIKESNSKNIHNEYLLKNLTDLNFKPNSFDAVILIESLEHIPKKEGIELLRKIDSWAKKKVIISTPNGYLPQYNIVQNAFQEHRSGWDVKEMQSYGYRAYGMAGWKFLRKENTPSGTTVEWAIFSTIKFRPKIFWMIASALTQVITYYFPKLAFEVFYVKNLQK
jgi:SAM-dependent methyltransferase